MQIKLKRAFGPDEVGVEETCGVCEHPFVTKVVEAHVLKHDLGLVCPACVAYLGRRNEGGLPTILEYQAWNGFYAGPVYETMEELIRNDEIGDPDHHEAYRASWIGKGLPLARPQTREDMAEDVVAQLDSAAGEAYEEGSVLLGERITEVLIPFVEREFGLEYPTWEKEFGPLKG